MPMLLNLSYYSTWARYGHRKFNMKLIYLAIQIAPIRAETM